MSINNQLIRQDFPILLDKIYNKSNILFNEYKHNEKKLAQQGAAIVQI